MDGGFLQVCVLNTRLTANKVSCVQEIVYSDNQHSLQFVVHSSVNCTPYAVQTTLYTVHCTLYTVQFLQVCVLNSELTGNTPGECKHCCTLYTIQLKVQFRVKYTVYCTLSNVYCTQTKENRFALYRIHKLYQLC